MLSFPWTLKLYVKGSLELFCTRIMYIKYFPDVWRFKMHLAKVVIRKERKPQLSSEEASGNNHLFQTFIQ